MSLLESEYEFQVITATSNYKECLCGEIREVALGNWDWAEPRKKRRFPCPRWWYGVVPMERPSWASSVMGRREVCPRDWTRAVQPECRQWLGVSPRGCCKVGFIHAVPSTSWMFVFTQERFETAQVFRTVTWSDFKKTCSSFFRKKKQCNFINITLFWFKLCFVLKMLYISSTNHFSFVPSSIFLDKQILSHFSVADANSYSCIVIVCLFPEDQSFLSWRFPAVPKTFVCNFD